MLIVMEIQRESMECDVLIIGAGPAGLSAAIRLAQLNQIQQRNLSIIVLEKAAQVGAHILSGAILEPTAIEKLIPDWLSKNPPIETSVKSDKFYYLSKSQALRLPILPAMKNHGNYIIRLSNFCEWLAKEAENLGVNIFPGFAANKILYDCDKTVVGIQTTDMGLNKDGSPSPRFQPGINIYAKQTFFAEGCRGSLSQQLMQKFNLGDQCDPQTYGIGLKEIWKIDPKMHQPGLVIHTAGWPLDNKTYGGAFLYHLNNNEIAFGFIVGLDYQNPYLDPFEEMQRLKLHPKFRPIFENGECLKYGAKALIEGGYQSIPKLTFPGGLLIGDAAGFLNVAKIKGIHNAMLSGMLAAESIFDQSTLNSHEQFIHYPKKISNSSIYKELYRARNIRPGFHRGNLWGFCNAAFDQFILRGNAPWTLANHNDYSTLLTKSAAKKINYPKPDKKIAFDKLTQVYLTGTHHREDEPCHLILKNPDLAIDVNYKIYDSPETRYCPANVYEIVEHRGQPKLQINAPNCIHCKTCDIKDPKQNIIWQTPEGGDGPNFSGM